MSAEQTKFLCESTRARLKQAISLLEDFLNEQTVSDLAKGKDPEVAEFYRGFMSDLRQLLVFSEVCDEKLGIALRRPNFHAEQAEKILYEIYHQCVNRFYYPRNESYSEEGRYAYTGQDAIRFRKKPIRAVRDVTLKAANIFAELREDLSYYENEYINRLRMQGEKV